MVVSATMVLGASGTSTDGHRFLPQPAHSDDRTPRLLFGERRGQSIGHGMKKASPVDGNSRSGNEGARITGQEGRHGCDLRYRAVTAQRQGGYDGFQRDGVGEKWVLEAGTAL